MPKPIKTITISITDEELINQIDSMQDVNWSAVTKACIQRYIERRLQPDISVILDKLEQEKGQEYVNGRLKADEIVVTVGYAKFNVMMKRYEEKVANAVDLDANGPPPEPWEYRPDSYDLLRDMLVSKKLIDNDVSLEYLKGLLNRLNVLNEELTK
jgi:hypothetical protein